MVEAIMVGPAKNVPSDAEEQQLRLIERRLARSEAARLEAEQLLETKSRSLTQAQDLLRQKEVELLEHVNRQTLSHVSAQNLANVATFYGDEDQQFIGSDNFAKVLGSKTPITSFEQFATMVHPHDQEDAMAILIAASEGRLVDKNIEGDFRFCDDYGKTRWLRWSVTQKRSSDGVRFFGYGAVRDITRDRQAERKEQILRKLSERRARQLQNLSNDLKSAREEEKLKSEQLAQRLVEMEMMGVALEEARATAVSANRSKSRFLAMMSHDIRTPMNAVLATLELLSITDLTQEQLNQVELARHSGDQLLFLLADIIEYGRADGWHLNLQMRELNLPELVQKAADTWQPLARKKKLEITTSLKPDCPDHIVTDPARTRQMIDNFISNAIKYTSDGRIELIADILTEDDGLFLKFSVSDNGVGIPLHLQETLFEELDRGDAENTEIEGTGLGLSICKRIINAMDGNIGVDSDIGKGSIFWFVIPISLGDGSELAAAKSQTLVSRRFQINGRAPKLLVAEDIEANQIVITAMLENMGCETVVVDDGSQVLDALSDGGFDGILMDVWMPMNGMDATRHIRASEQYAKIPIFGVTAFAGDTERTAILASGMDGVISKPINLSGLHYVVGQICGLEEQHTGVESENQKRVPEFGEVEFLNRAKFEEQIYAVPGKRRTALVEAVSNDIVKWCERFAQAWMVKDERGVNAAHHALRGICSGFGAYALLEKIDVIRQNGKLGSQAELLPVQDMLDYTIAALRRPQQWTDQRRD